MATIITDGEDDHLTKDTNISQEAINFMLELEEYGSKQVFWLPGTTTIEQVGPYGGRPSYLPPVNELCTVKDREIISRYLTCTYIRTEADREHTLRGTMNLSDEGRMFLIQYRATRP